MSIIISDQKAGVDNSGNCVDFNNPAAIKCYSNGLVCFKAGFGCL